MKDRYMIKENYLLLIIIIGILSLCMYSSFALFSLEKTTTKDIITMKSASDIQTTLKVFEYKQVKVSAGNNRSVMVNVSNDTGKNIYYGVFYEMVNPSTKSDDIGIYKIDWSTNPTVGTINNDEKLPVELLIINNTSSEITINIGVAGADSNELGLEQGKYIVTETFNTGQQITQTVAHIQNFDYTGSVQSTSLIPGSYKLEVWGAEGGYGYTDATTYAGGKGGYSYGTLSLNSSTNIYIYVGGQGENGTSSASIKQGGFNGGGNSGYNMAGSGGGASDIRIGEDSLYSRVIVAGGGGGGAYYSAYYGGAGGGTSAIDGTGYNTTYNSKGGVQTAGGAAGYYSSYTGTSGSFGVGGAANTTSSNYNRSGGGGGGWYGGGGGAYRSSSSNYRYGVSGGGGGSGYVYTSSTASNYPTGVKLTSSYYLTDASTVAGNTSFTDSDGNTVTGRSGNGYARITNLDTTPSIDTSSVGIEKEPIVALKDLVTCEDNGTGCKIVLVKPATSESINGSVNAIYVLEDNNGNRYKYYKKVSIKENAVKKIINLSKGDSWEATSSDSTVYAEGLYATNKYTDTDGTEKYHEYRYIGPNPNNYVWFNDDLYQIIGVFDSNSHGKDGYLIKLIMANPIGAYSWGIYNTSNTSGTYSGAQKDWIGSKSGVKANLNILYNEFFYNKSYTSTNYGNCSTWSYYNNGGLYKTNNCSTIVGFGLSENSKKLIQDDVTWYLNGIYGMHNSKSKTDMYSCERGDISCSSDKKTTGPIGLMYPSDYMYASSYYSSKDSTLSNVNYYGNNNWLYIGPEWTIMPSTYDETGVLYVNGGSLDMGGTGKAYHTRPSFYLKADASFGGGDGTINNPYQVIY